MKKTLKPPKQNDELLKGAVKDNFPDFLRFLYPGAEHTFDFSRGIEFMDKELHKIMPDRERKKGTRVADLLAKVHLKNGSEKWILVHTETEGGNQKNFAHRLYIYWYRLYDRYNVRVETIAVFTGDEKQHRTSVHLHKGIFTRVHFEFLTYHILDHSQEDLLAMDNIFSLIVLACQKALKEGEVPDEKLGEDRLTIVKALLRHNYEHKRIVSFLVFLKNFLHVNNVEINRIFDKQLEQLSGGTFNMGVIEVVKKQEKERILQQGLEQGLQQGLEQSKQELERKSAEVVRNLVLELKLTDEQVARIAGETVDFVRKIRKDLGN